MSMIFLAKGTATMGRTTRDKDGNIVSHTPAQFTVDDSGSCVAVGELDPETMKPKGPVTGIYGYWDAAGYLAQVMELLKPERTVNIPDLRSMILAAIKDGTDFCSYCERQGYYCRDCIIREWEEETRE